MKLSERILAQMKRDEGQPPELQGPGTATLDEWAAQAVMMEGRLARYERRIATLVERMQNARGMLL